MRHFRIWRRAQRRDGLLILPLPLPALELLHSRYVSRGSEKTARQNHVGLVLNFSVNGCIAHGFASRRVIAAMICARSSSVALLV